MTDQPEKNQEPSGAGAKFLWVICGLIPSVVAVASFQIKLVNDSENLLFWLAVTDAVFSVVASFGLAYGMKNKLAYVLAGMGLSFLFFVINVVVGLFLGCALAAGH